MPQYFIRPFWLAVAVLFILLTGCASAPGSADTTSDSYRSTQPEHDPGEGASASGND